VEKLVVVSILTDKILYMKTHAEFADYETKVIKISILVSLVSKSENIAWISCTIFCQFLSRNTVDLAQ
jgi:hypothetical protein